MKMKASVSPNPFTSHLSLEVSVDGKESVIVSMLDHEQSIVRMFSWPLQAGKNKVSFNDVNSLGPGEYSVTVTNQGGKNLFATRVIKNPG